MENQAKQIADSKKLVIDYIAGTKEKGVYMFKAISGEVVRFNKDGVVGYKWEKDIKRMTDPLGKPYTIEELYKLNGNAFKKAGLTAPK